MNNAAVLSSGCKFVRCGAIFRTCKRGKGDISTVGIHPRKERGPTDVLQALSETVKQDKYALEYKYPMSGIFGVKSAKFKRVVSVASESGRKAAKWVVEQNPTLFNHKNAVPYIKAFAPPATYDAGSDVSEETLINAIQETEVKGAMKIYEVLKERNMDVSDSTKEMLLELTCFYNGADKPDETLLEEKYFGNKMGETTLEWDNPFSESLFEEMTPSSYSYSALIQGLFKYGNYMKGFKMYEEACQKGLQLSVGVYNSVLANISFQHKIHDNRKAMMIEVMKGMKERGIKPNLGTLNGALTAIGDMRTWTESRRFALDVFHELRHAGVEPSLGTYYKLLQIFFDKTKTDIIFFEILDEVGEREWEMRHQDDVLFFPKAMQICSVNFNNSALAKKVYNAIKCGNMKFLNTNIISRTFYRYYFTALFNSNDMEYAMKSLSEVMRNVYPPELNLMSLALASVANQKTEYLLQLWEYIKELNYDAYPSIMQTVLNTITVGYESSMKEISQDISVRILDALENPSEHAELKMNWSSELISQLLLLNIYSNDEDMVLKMFNKAQELKADIDLSSKSCRQFVLFCAKTQRKEMALICLKDYKLLKYPKINSLIDEVRSAFELNSSELEMLSNMEEENNTIGEKSVDTQATAKEIPSD